MNQSDVICECKICLSTASDPIVTPCGHIFCWSCYFEWEQQSKKTNQTYPKCPSCQTRVPNEGIIPLYTRTGVEQSQVMPDVPTRPRPNLTLLQEIQTAEGGRGIFHVNVDLVLDDRHGRRVPVNKRNKLKWIGQSLLLVGCAIPAGYFLYKQDWGNPKKEFMNWALSLWKPLETG